MKLIIFLTLVLHTIGTLGIYQNRQFPILRKNIVADDEIYQNRNFPVLRKSLTDGEDHILSKRFAPKHGPVKHFEEVPVVHHELSKHYEPIHVETLVHHKPLHYRKQTPVFHHEPSHYYKEVPVHKVPVVSHAKEDHVVPKRYASNFDHFKHSEPAHVHWKPVEFHEVFHHEPVQDHKEGRSHKIESVKHHRIPAHEPIHYLKRAAVHEEPKHHHKGVPVHHKVHHETVKEHKQSHHEPIKHHKEIHHEPIKHHKELPINHDHFHKKVPEVHHEVHHEEHKEHKKPVEKKEKEVEHHHVKHEPVKYEKHHAPSHKHGHYGKFHHLHKRSAGYWNQDYTSPTYHSYDDSYPSYSWDSTYEKNDDDFYSHSTYPTHYDKYEDNDYYSHYPYHTHDYGHCPWKKPTKVVKTTVKPPAPTTKKPVKAKVPIKQTPQSVITAVGNALLDVRDQLLNPGNPQRPANQVRPISVQNPNNPGVAQEGLFVPLVRPFGVLRNDENETRLNTEEEDELAPVIEDPVNLDPSFGPLDTLRIDQDEGSDVDETEETNKKKEQVKQDELSTPQRNIEDLRSLTLEDFGIDIRAAVNPRR